MADTLQKRASIRRCVPPQDSKADKLLTLTLTLTKTLTLTLTPENVLIIINSRLFQACEAFIKDQFCKGCPSDLRPFGHADSF